MKETFVHPATFVLRSLERQSTRGQASIVRMNIANFLSTCKRPYSLGERQRDSLRFSHNGQQHAW